MHLTSTVGALGSQPTARPLSTAAYEPAIVPCTEERLPMLPPVSGRNAGPEPALEWANGGWLLPALDPAVAGHPLGSHAEMTA